MRDNTPPETFALQEIIANEKLSDKFRLILNAFDIPTPNVRSNRDMGAERILYALYDSKIAEKTFALFKEIRKTMKMDMAKQQSTEEDDKSAPKQSTPGTPSISSEFIKTLPTEKFRDIMEIIFSGDEPIHPTPAKSAKKH